MKWFARLAALGTFVLCATSAARADASSDLQGEIEHALRAVKSFAATSVVPQAGTTIKLVFVAPNRLRTDVTDGTNSTSAITIGEVSYASKNGSPYQKFASAAEQRDLLESARAVTVTAIQPDIVANSITYGAYETIVGEGASAFTLACTYDKKTYLPAVCTGSRVVQTFSDYNSPKNIIELPKEMN